MAGGSNDGLSELIWLRPFFGLVVEVVDDGEGGDAEAGGAHGDEGDCLQRFCGLGGAGLE